MQLNYRPGLDNINPEIEYDLHNEDLFIPEFHVRGIYVSGWAAGTPHKIEPLIKMADNTVINTMVIDIKDEMGNISYHSRVGLAERIGSGKEKIKDIEELIATLHKKGLYIIGRIVVFKDPILAKNRPELALSLYSGEKKESYRSVNWVDPEKKEVWQYNIELAREAIARGFDEIQFDYIRYPALARKPIKVIMQDGSSKSNNINEFIIQAGKELQNFNTPLSIDVFGLTTTVNDDLGIGQNFRELSQYIDIISPMVYPSHYAAGSYGVEVPALDPYGIVYKSIYDAREKVRKDKRIRIRPWIQDFSLEHNYEAVDIRAQIRALEDLGIKEWLLWNPHSRYTEEALFPPYRIKIDS